MLEHIDEEAAASINFTFDDQVIKARLGDSIASALLAAGEIVVRSTPVSGASRGPFCMMGVCFECLVEVNGVPDRQACMQPAVEGLVVRRGGGH